MTPAAYNAALLRLGIGHAAAAELLGVNAHTSRNYGHGATRVPGPVARLLWAIERDATLAEALGAAFVPVVPEGLVAAAARALSA